MRKAKRRRPEERWSFSRGFRNLLKDKCGFYRIRFPFGEPFFF